MKTKRLIPVIILLLCISGPSLSANGFIDPFFTSISTGDAETQMGGGAGLGFNFLRDWYFVSKFTYAFAEKNSGLDKYGHMMYMAGTEYDYTIIPRLKARATLMLGYSLTIIEVDTQDRISDSGANLGFWLGLSYDINQWFTPFIDFGYHKSLYADELKNKTIAGFQVLIGARFMIFGQNKSIMTDY